MATRHRRLKILGVIPARGGSEGVPGKNIRVIAGEPLIAYAVRAAKESRSLTHFLTTTDKKDIARIAERYGSPVLMRPRGLARGDTKMPSVILHALREAEKRYSVKYDIVLLLQPSSPIRTGKDIDAAVKILEKDPNAECVISVSKMDGIHPARMYNIGKSGGMRSLSPRLETCQRKGLPPVYYRNGAIYAVRRETLIKRHTLMGKNKRPYMMPLKYLVNIDNERDFITAEPILRLWKKERRL